MFPRRRVDRTGGQFRITRKSAPVRITALPRQLPADTTQAEETTPNSTTAVGAKALPRGRRHETIEFESELGGDDSDSDSNYNSFILSIKKKDLLQSDTQLTTEDRNSLVRSASPTPSLKGLYGSQAATYRVVKSTWAGDIYKNSKLSAQLTVLPNNRPSDYSKPIYRWLHLENPEMNFEAYMEFATKCPYLADSERVIVTSVLRTAREKSDRSLRMPLDKIGSYVEPEYFEETIQNTVFQGPRSKRITEEIVRWIAIPYFFLTPIAGQNTGYHCVHGRELRPQLAKKGCIGEGKYFQVAQFWCLMLGDSLMISCARISISEIPGDLINLNHLPPTTPAQSSTWDKAPMLQVSDGGLRLWLLPLDQCKTWHKFIMHFASLGFSLVDGWQVKYRELLLDANDWSKVIAMAKKSAIRLDLCRRVHKGDIGTAHSSSTSLSETELSSVPTTSAVQQVDGHAKDSFQKPQAAFSFSEPRVLSDTLDGTELKSSAQLLHVDKFHVFTLLATVHIAPLSLKNEPPGTPEISPSPQFRIDEQKLQDDLLDIDQYLTSGNTRGIERASYLECPRKTSYDVEATITKLSTIDRGEYNNKKAFIRAARDILELFCPLRYEKATIILKFWGSVDRIVQTQGIKSAHGQFGIIVKEISKLAQLASEIREETFSSDASDYTTTLPHEFLQAWMLLQMYLIGLATDHSYKYANHLQRCKERLMKGRLKMVERLQPVSLRSREAALPLGITTLLLSQLLHDSQGPLTPERHRLTSSYWTLFQDFKTKVHSRPLNRKYEATFVTIKSELETIIGALEDQLRVLIAIEDSIDEAETHSFASISSIPNSLEPTREASITEYLLHETEEALQNFREISRQLNELESWHFLCLSIDNDMQQKAAFAFTTVTVFFLPLTTLTGILGMNTSDIRNMAGGSWIFWAVGVPLGVFCLSVWFAYLGSFERFWRWSRRTSQRTGNTL